MHTKIELLTRKNLMSPSLVFTLVTFKQQAFAHCKLKSKQKKKWGLSFKLQRKLKGPLKELKVFLSLELWSPCRVVHNKEPIKQVFFMKLNWIAFDSMHFYRLTTISSQIIPFSLLQFVISYTISPQISK